MTDDLTRLGRRLARLRADHKATMEAMYEAIRDAHAGGMPETQIAKAAGVDRMTVRRALGKRD